MSDAILSINATFGERASSEVEGIENKVKASMRAVLKDNWMETNDDALFRAGIAGALLDVGQDSEEGKHLIESIDALKKFNAFLSAASAGLSVDIAEIMPNENERQPLPLIGWWHDVKQSA